MPPGTLGIYGNGVGAALLQRGEEPLAASPDVHHARNGRKNNDDACATGAFAIAIITTTIMIIP